MARESVNYLVYAEIPAHVKVAIEVCRLYCGQRLTPVEAELLKTAMGTITSSMLAGQQPASTA